MNEVPSPQHAYMAAVAAILASNNRLTPLGAGILAAVILGIANDSRSFALSLSVSHAVVLREIGALVSGHRLLTVTKRTESTQRTFYRLTPQAGTVADIVSRLA